MKGLEKFIEDNMVMVEKLYNREQKLSYLRDEVEDEGTKVGYLVYLVQMADFERLFEKDICEFSRDNILDMFFNSFSTSPTALRLRFTVGKRYCDYCNEKGFSTTGSNTFNEIDFGEEILPVVNNKSIRKRFITEEELWELAETQGANYQDIICPLLVYYKIRGNKLAEILNLKESDIDRVNNTLTVEDFDGSKKIVKVPEKLIKFIDYAIGEELYELTAKTKDSESEMRSTSRPLLKSEYVVRPIKKGNIEKASAQLVGNRVKRIFERAGKDELSINDIYLSAKLAKLKAIEDEKGELTFHDYKEVQESFGDDVNNYNPLREYYEIIFGKGNK